MLRWNEIKQGLLAAGLGSLLAGCMMGPDFARPAAPTTQTYTAEPLTDLQDASGQRIVTAPESEQAWWTPFHSAALDAVMKQALADNLGLAASASTLEQAQEAVKASSGDLYPNVGLEADAGRERYGPQFLGTNPQPAFNYFSVGPTVRYLFDYAGGAHRAVEQQQALADEQTWQLQAARLSLTGQVAQQALTIASVRAQIATLESLLKEDQDNLSLVTGAFDNGAVSRLDVLTAQTQLANDQTLLPPLHQQLSLARHALAILVGRAPGDWTPPDFDITELQLPMTLPVSLPSDLARRRPDILAAEAQLHAATAGMGVAEANLYPQISLTAAIDQQSTSLSKFFDQSGIAYSLAGAITAPIFDGGTLRAQNRASKDAMRAAFSRYQQTVLQSFGQVSDVLAALDHDAEQLAAQQNATDASDANLKLTRESYSAGNVGVLQVLDAERLSQQARLGLVRAQAQRFQDTAQLFLSLGGNTVSVGDAAAAATLSDNSQRPAALTHSSAVPAS